MSILCYFSESLPSLAGVLGARFIEFTSPGKCNGCSGRYTHNVAGVEVAGVKVGIPGANLAVDPCNSQALLCT